MQNDKKMYPEDLGDKEKVGGPNKKKKSFQKKSKCLLINEDII